MLIHLTLLRNQRICRCAVTQLLSAEIVGYFPNSVPNELPTQQYWPPFTINSAECNVYMPVVSVVVCDGAPLS